MTVGSYSRISYGDDNRLGVGRQEQDNASLIRMRGWEAGPTYADQNISAYSGVIRPEFERMLVDLEAGKISGIVCWDLDRLARRPDDLERVIKIYDHIPGLVFSTVQGDLQLATSDGRTLARVMCAFANKASSDTSRRVARKRLDSAMNGDTWSTYRPFGWNEDRLTLNEFEAEIIQQAARDVLNGVGLFIICGKLNARNISTVRGNRWKTSAMRRILNSPRLAGFAVYRAELLMDEDGNPVKGKWESILDEETWRAVVSTLNSGKRITQRKHHYLLTAIARCGLCGCGMVGGTPKQGRRRYTCRSPDSGGCAKVAIVMDKLDQQIESLVLEYIGTHEVAVNGTQVWIGEGRLQDINHKIAELMQQYNNDLAGSIVFPAVRKLQEEQRILQAEKAQYTKKHRRQTVTIEGEWPEWNIEERRAVILKVLEAVIINPTGRTGMGYNPDRVDVVYRQPVAQAPATVQSLELELFPTHAQSSPPTKLP